MLSAFDLVHKNTQPLNKVHVISICFQNLLMDLISQYNYRLEDRGLYGLDKMTKKEEEYWKKVSSGGGGYGHFEEGEETNEVVGVAAGIAGIIAAANEPKCTTPLANLPHHVLVIIGFSSSTKGSQSGL